MSTPEHELPPLQEGYEDQFGPIDPDVYEAARKIWPSAVEFGDFALHDRSLVLNLMMKAVADVSKVLAEGNEIKSLRAYLRMSFKHLVVRERKKTLPRSRPLSEAPEAITDVVTDLDRKILAREIFARLDKFDRTIILLWMMERTDKQIAETLGLNPAVVRKRISRLIMRLGKTYADIKHE